MSSIQLDETGDILVTDNRLTLTEGLEAIRQHLWVKLQIFLGEWFLDNEIGVPWFRDVLIKNPSFVVVQQVLKDQILTTQGVLELLEFDFELNTTTRVATLNFKARCDDGIIDFTLPVSIAGVI